MDAPGAKRAGLSHIKNQEKEVNGSDAGMHINAYLVSLGETFPLVGLLSLLGFLLEKRG